MKSAGRRQYQRRKRSSRKQLSTSSEELSTFSKSDQSSNTWGSCFLKQRETSQKNVYEPNSLRKRKQADIELASLRFERRVLYGRDQETKILGNVLTAACSVDNPCRKQVTLVSGTSGVGKSSLVDKLRAPTEKAGGIYALGKYDFQQQNVPYPAITEACRTICEHLALNPPSDKRRVQLKKELGSSIFTLGQILPSILELVGIQKHTEESSSVSSDQVSGRVAEAQHRFLFAFGGFIRIVASWGPLVIVLDDLQWADQESFHLLEALMNDPNLKGLVLVRCYRSNEVEDTHRLSKWIRDVESSQMEVDLTRLELSELDVDAVNEMLSAVLSVDMDETTALASVVHKRTHGNAFFVIQYLKSLQERNILEFNLGVMRWIWSVKDIEANTDATDNVVDLMKKKMEALPNELCEVLPLAACLGSTFPSHILLVVVDVFQRERRAEETRTGSSTSTRRETSPTRWLEIFVDEGFIEKGDDTYNWTHDKIQEAALALVVVDKLSMVKFRVGEVLLRSLNRAEISESIFVVTSLLNQGLELRVVEAAMSLQIAKLNLEAGRAAMASASFSQAAMYFETAIACLPEGHWESEYELSLELYSSAAEAEYGTGNVENMEENCKEIIRQRHRPISDKFRAYNVLIPSIGNRNRIHEACDTLVSVLEELGCRFPKYCQLFFVLNGIMSTMVTLKRYEPEDFTIFKEMTDESQIQAMRMLDKLATFSYFIDGSLLLPLAILKSFRWSIKYGVSEFSPPAFVLVGLILCTKIGDLQGGRTYAEYALSLIASNLDYEAVESRTLFLAHTFVLHATMPHQKCLKPLLQGYASGLATGDVESAMWNIEFYLEYSFVQGKELGPLDADFDIYSKQMKAFNQLRHYTFALFMWQLVRSLRGLSENPRLLKGDVFDVDAFEGDKYLVSVCRFRQIHLSHFMVDDLTGAELAYKLKKEYTVDELSPGTFGLDYVEGQIAIMCYGAVRKTKKKQYLSTAKKSHKYIRDIGKKGNPNFVHYEELIDAELAASKGRKLVAIKHYESAILLAARRGIVHDQGVANERLADFMLDCGDINEAKYRWNRAIELYTEWGATAKVKQVTAKLDAVNAEPETRPD